jgi:D-hydroxyproline dehydrogenase subunit gamma
MLKHIKADKRALLAFTFEGRPVQASDEDTVASALLAAGETVFRSTPVSGAARGPFCLMGACFDCLVEIDGTPNRQACMQKVRDGMVVRRQRGLQESELS